MSTYVSGHFTREAAADLSAKQYFIVKLDSNGKVALAAAATDAFIGVLQNKPKSGENAEVRLINAEGTLKVKLGGTVSKDGLVTANSSGKGVATTTVGDFLLGRAMEAGVDGDIIEVLPIGHQRYAAIS